MFTGQVPRAYYPKTHYWVTTCNYCILQYSIWSYLSRVNLVAPTWSICFFHCRSAGVLNDEDLCVWILQLLFVFRKSQRFQDFKQSNKYPFDTPTKTLVAEHDKWDTSFPKWEMWTWHGHSCSVPVVLFSQRKPSSKCRAVLLFGLGLPSQFGATVAFARHFQTVHWLGCSLVLPQACNCMQDHSTSIPILKFTSFYIHSIPFSCCPNSQKKMLPVEPVVYI